MKNRKGEETERRQNSELLQMRLLAKLDIFTASRI